MEGLNEASQKETCDNKEKWWEETKDLKKINSFDDNNDNDNNNNKNNRTFHVLSVNSRSLNIR